MTDPKQPDDLRDKLVDHSLEEIGGKTPRDHTESILSKSHPHAVREASGQSFAIVLAICMAAGLLLLVGGSWLMHVEMAPVAMQAAAPAVPVASPTDQSLVVVDDSMSTSEREDLFRDLDSESGRGEAAQAGNAPTPASVSMLRGKTGATEQDYAPTAPGGGAQPARPADPRRMPAAKPAEPFGDVSSATPTTPTTTSMPAPLVSSPSPGLAGPTGQSYATRNLPTSGPVPMSPPVASGKKLAELQDHPAPGEEREKALGIAVAVEDPTSAEGYAAVPENAFIPVGQEATSTFSIDVDTASYSNIRRFLMQNSLMPPPNAVRIEEMVNYFPYQYQGPSNDQPFSAHLEMATCPWQPKHRLVRIALKGKEIETKDRPTSNLVFLFDVSGSMSDYNKLPLLKQAFRMLIDNLGENDRVAIVVYAGASGLVLPSTRCDEKTAIIDALDRLQAGGSTNGGAGIELAYKIAAENFIRGGVNRVILATDGDFNVGNVSHEGLEALITEKAKTGVFLSVLGFGYGNLKDDTLEKLADKGNGNYGYIDTVMEARKVLVEEMNATLVTIAKDVKIQVEFNPALVKAYRLVGYENRVLANQDFHDDTKDAGEIGAGHAVTAFYEVIMADSDAKIPGEGDGQPAPTTTSTTTDAPAAADPALPPAVKPTGDVCMMLRLKYKKPDAEKSEAAQEFSLKPDGKAFTQASTDFQFAASVAEFGLVLKQSKYLGEGNLNAVLEMAQAAKGSDNGGYRAEFIQVLERAKGLMPK